MAREEFIDNLRAASRSLPPPRTNRVVGARTDRDIAVLLRAADLWLTPRAVHGFNVADFPDLSEAQCAELAKAVAAFRAVAERAVAGRALPHKPAKKIDSARARKHLEHIIRIVREAILREWLAAQEKMIGAATAAAEAKNWYVEKDEKDVEESLLGSYKALDFLSQRATRRKSCLIRSPALAAEARASLTWPSCPPTRPCISSRSRTALGRSSPPGGICTDGRLAKKHW